MEELINLKQLKDEKENSCTTGPDLMGSLSN